MTEFDWLEGFGFVACDLHIHSKYSFDGTADMDTICCAAIDRGVDVIAITDHCDMTDGLEGISSYLKGENKRQKDFKRVCSQYEGIQVLCGIELGNPHEAPCRTHDFMALRTFDFVIGAVHFLPDGSDIYKLSYPDAQSVDTMFRQYFASMRRLMELGGFDSLAHLDYPLRVLQGKVSEPTIRQYCDLVEPILELLVAKEIALEINTRGIYDWQRRVGPEEWVLRRYRALGGKYVTIGSDAHVPKWIGAGFAEAGLLLKQAGFDDYTIYENRIPRQIPILI